MNNFFLFLTTYFLTFSAYGAEYQLDINLNDYCDDVLLQKKDCLVCNETNELTNSQNENTIENFSQNILSPLNLSLGDPDKRKLTCETLLSSTPLTVSKKDSDGDTWNVKFYFGYSRAKYFNSDVHLQSTRVNVDIKDMEWKERNSFEYFKRESLKGKGNTFRFIDEPTSTMMLTLEKGKNVFLISVFHLKYLKQQFQDKHVTGTLDGVSVNGVIPINEPFDGYNDQPGQMHLTRLENTYWQADIQGGYGRKFNLLGNEKTGILSFTPYVQGGIYIGSSFSNYRKLDNYWDWDSRSQPIEPKGASITLGQKLEYEKGRFSLFLDNRATHAQVKHDFLDGKASYKLNFVAGTLGLGFKIVDPKSKKKKKIPTDP